MISGPPPHHLSLIVPSQSQQSIESPPTEHTSDKPSLSSASVVTSSPSSSPSASPLSESSDAISKVSSAVLDSETAFSRSVSAFLKEKNYIKRDNVCLLAQLIDALKKHPESELEIEKEFKKNKEFMKLFYFARTISKDQSMQKILIKHNPIINSYSDLFKFTDKPYMAPLFPVINKERCILLDKGKCKLVYIPLQFTRENANVVYYKPIKAEKAKEMREEVAIMQGIKQSEEKEGKERNNRLAIRTNYIPGQNETIQTERAVSNLQSTLREMTPRDFERASDFGGDAMEAFRQLHKDGFIYGDPKPENFLRFEEEQTDGAEASIKEIIKLSDFGKTKKKSPVGSEPYYTGNMKYSPPEGRLSQAGDVWAAGLLLIGILEAPFIDKSHPQLKEVVGEKDSTSSPGEALGIEKYLIEHPACRAYNSEGMSDIEKGALRGFRQLWSNAALKSEEVVINQYITALQTKLIDELVTKASPPLKTAQQITDLCNVIRRMVDHDPAKRPTMEQVVAAYKLF